MKIQVISYREQIKYRAEHEYTYSSLDAPISLDAFDLNIISLQSPELWQYEDNNNDSIDSIRDLLSLKKLLDTVKKSKTIVCLPQNYQYLYYYYSGHYHKQCQLKDMITKLKIILENLIPSGHPFEILYENSTTICGNTKYSAAFCFNNYLDENRIITKCRGSEHVTTYQANSCLIFTTLDFSESLVNLNDFLKVANIIKDDNVIPLWIQEFKFFDDEIQENIVIEANDEIEKQKQIIQAAQKKLEENLRYKSILFESGDALVKVVFEILEKITNYNLSDFVDKKDEDFKITLRDVTFIGEIKGITSNVKSEHISQLDVHCQTYIDNLDEDGRNENVKGILIINPLRNKSINERDEVHERQIQLANRNKSLIVTTETLLFLFVAYLEGRVTADTIIELLKNKIGLLKTSDFI